LVLSQESDLKGRDWVSHHLVERRVEKREVDVSGASS
jgi:hypothetical protein